MKICSAEFVQSCVSPEDYPRERLPEVAFVGRSNVGKSSAINSLLYRRGLAKVSGTPGKTRTVNFFRVATTDPLLKRFYLVDLPGYGYAKASRSVREQWGPMIERYLTSRPTLQGVVLVVDARGLESSDLATIQWLWHIGHHPAVVGIKVDKLTFSERRPLLMRVRTSLTLSDSDEVVLYSAQSHEGRSELWQVIRRMMGIKGKGVKECTQRFD